MVSSTTISSGFCTEVSAVILFVVNNEMVHCAAGCYKVYQPL